MTNTRKRLSPTVSAVAADAAVRKAGLHSRLAGKVPGGVRVLVDPPQTDAIVRVLAERWPTATVIREDDYSVLIVPAGAR